MIIVSEYTARIAEQLILWVTTDSLVAAEMHQIQGPCSCFVCQDKMYEQQ